MLAMTSMNREHSEIELSMCLISLATKLNFSPFRYNMHAHRNVYIHLIEKTLSEKSVSHERCDTMELWEAALALFVPSSFYWYSRYHLSQKVFMAY